jgi:hypothetical protein
MDAATLVRELRVRGVRLWKGADGLYYEGPVLAADVEALRLHKSELLSMVESKAPGEPVRSRDVPAETWEAMRRLAPLVGRTVHDGDREGVLWGVTPHGAIFDTGAVLLTLEHEAVQP